MPPRIRLTASSSSFPSLALPSTFAPTRHTPSQCRTYAVMVPPKKTKDKKDKKDRRTDFIQHDLRTMQQFSLAEAMRYIKAMEVGRDPARVKYDIAVKLKTPKNGPQVRDRVRLPTPVRTDTKICVIAEGQAAEDAMKAGAALVGTEEVFELVRNGPFEFDLVLCHDQSFQALTKSKVARILGPRGLMPSAKMGTVVKNPASAISDLVGKASYRERLGVVRMAIGQLGFTEKQLQDNIRAFMTQLKRDMAKITQVSKSISEVVLSSTNSAGFSLNGRVESEQTE